MEKTYKVTRGEAVGGRKGEGSDPVNKNRKSPQWKPTVGEGRRKAGWNSRWGSVGKGRRAKGKTMERKKKGRAERKEVKRKGDDA